MPTPPEQSLKQAEASLKRLMEIRDAKQRRYRTVLLAQRETDEDLESAQLEQNLAWLPLRLSLNELDRVIDDQIHYVASLQENFFDDLFRTDD